MSDQGNPCKDIKEPHATRFKDHLLSLLLEWSEFSRENKGRKDIYISHKATVADEFAKKKCQTCQAEALILMRAAVIIHKLCLESQEPFNGSFSANCITAPVNKNMRIFLNTVLQGHATVFGKRNINDYTNQDARDKIACIISQLLMYNATKGIHHTVETDTVRHSKGERNPTSPVLWSQASCAWSIKKSNWHSTGTAYLCILQTCHGSEARHGLSSLCPPCRGWSSGTNKQPYECLYNI